MRRLQRPALRSGQPPAVWARLRRGGALLLVALAALLGAALAPAAAGPALVADLDSGRVLYARQATDPWYPASVTKLMTAYLTLHALRSGQLRPDSPLTVSARAAAVIPSKMGFKPGVEVTVDNALKMMLVKSANDMAVVLAEGVGGSVENFAGMMNQAAEELGMGQSHFVNPNGLPDPGNRTSARDLAVLARTMLRQFPEYAHYFSIEAVQLGKRVFKNTNGLVGRYPGVTGMKTGFICSSGFNVVATAARGNRRLLVVVLGAHSGVERTLIAASLFDRGFADSGWGGPGTLDTLPLPTSAAPPDMRDSICGAGRGARGEEEAENAPQNASPLFALFKGGASDWEAPVAGRTLPPRAALAAIPVYVGRYPGAPATAVAAHRGRAQKGETASAYAADEETSPGAKALQKVKRPAARRNASAQKASGDQKASAETKQKAGKTEPGAKSQGKKAADKKQPAKKPAGKNRNASNNDG